jgi:hypothetical protein
VRGARLDGSLPADCLAVLALVDWVAPTAGDQSARAASLDDLVRVDCLVVPVLVDSAALMAVDSAERDCSRPDARSEQAGCPGGLPAGSLGACWLVGLAWQRLADLQAAHYRVDPVWQHSAGSRVGLLADSPVAPCSVLRAFPEVPV